MSHCRRCRRGRWQHQTAKHWWPRGLDADRRPCLVLCEGIASYFWGCSLVSRVPTHSGKPSKCFGIDSGNHGVSLSESQSWHFWEDFQKSSWCFHCLFRMVGESANCATSKFSPWTPRTPPPRFQQSEGQNPTSWVWGSHSSFLWIRDRKRGQERQNWLNVFWAQAYLFGTEAKNVLWNLMCRSESGNRCFDVHLPISDCCETRWKRSYKWSRGDHQVIDKS